MSEIKITVQDQYLSLFLNYLKTLNYVEVEHVASKKKKVLKKSDVQLEKLALNDPLRQVIKPILQAPTLAQLAKEQNYVKTDWNRLRKVADEMDIQEPIEDLLAQLSA